MLLAVSALQQLQGSFLFFSAKMVPGCFCCLTGCWQEPPFWTVLIVVLLTAGEPGSQALSHCPWQAWGPPALGTRDRLRLEWDMVPVARQGRAVGSWRLVLLWCHWGRDQWPQGIMKWGRGQGDMWGWQCSQSHFGSPAPAPGCAGVPLAAAVWLWAWGQTHLPAPCWGLPEGLLWVINLEFNQIPDCNASARRGWLLESGCVPGQLEMLQERWCPLGTARRNYHLARQQTETFVKGECKPSAPAWPSGYIKMLVLVCIEVSLQTQSEFAPQQSTFKWKTKENVKHSVCEK